jgi:PAS domain S-box-containing protein
MIARHVLDNLLEGCQVIDHQLRYVYVNATAAAHGRTTVEELLGRTMMEAYPGIETTPMFRVLRRCMEDRVPQVMENEFLYPDGSKRWFELRIEPVPEGVAILSMDIGDRKRAEAAERRHLRALSVLSACNQTLVRATDEQRFMDDVCKLIVERGGYRLAWIGMKEDGTERMVRPVSRAGVDDGYVDEAWTRWDDSERGAGPTGRAICTGQPVVARDIATDPAFAPWREGALARGFASSIALPIRDGGEVLGALNIYASEPDAFDETEQELLGELALDLGHGLATLRDRRAREQADAQVRRSREAQQTIAAILRLALDNRPLNELLPEVLRRILSISWLGTERRGAIFLVEGEPGVLVLKAGEKLPAGVCERCARVLFGTCVCGRVARDNRAVYSADLNAPHETAYEGMEPHGHYCFPIHFGGEMLGVLNLYLAPGHARSAEEWDFLNDAANAIAGIVAHRRADEAQQMANEHIKLVQRLEAVGRLAGGVAHDFNNLLSVIISYADFLAEEVGESAAVRADVEEIRAAARRAASLTRQLLAFGRKQILQPEVLNLNETVRGIDKMLRRLLEEDIEIDLRLDETLGNVMADPTQIEQVIVNLAVNARDAMPMGGTLTIETANVELDASYAGGHIAAQPGRYVLLAISDTGVGMDAETVKHIFDPFFTTKEKGHGTGLGLATVYGIVKQSGGSIWVYSEPGRGSTFKIYLPRVDASPVELGRRPISDHPGGRETVLVVEDEEAVRAAAERILRRAGYQVLSAAGGGDALLLCEKHPGEIDLLLTDVVMPRMSGRELADRLVKLRPRLKVLYMSGYTDNAIVHHGVLDPGTRFVGKPFTASELTCKVREALDEGRIDTGGPERVG